jgi:hypothetical protein
MLGQFKELSEMLLNRRCTVNSFNYQLLMLVAQMQKEEEFNPRLSYRLAQALFLGLAPEGGDGE